MGAIERVGIIIQIFYSDFGISADIRRERKIFIDNDFLNVPPGTICYFRYIVK